MNTMLQAENISFGYTSFKPLINSFSLELRQKELLGLIGPNGAGKTTLFRLLSGYLQPSQGAIFLSGRDVRHLSHRERAGLLAVVPQHVKFPLPYTVRQLVKLGRTSKLSPLLPLSDNDHQAIRDAINRMELDELADAPFDQLSGGESQRAILAAALAQEPTVLLLDEPTASLDLKHTVKLMELLDQLRGDGLAVMMISHDIELAARRCSRLILLNKGGIVAQGAPRDVITQELILKAYGCKVTVCRGQHGEPLLSHSA